LFLADLSHSLREKYRHLPRSLHEGWGSQSNLPADEKVFVPEVYLTSPRTIFPYYGSMRPRTASTSDIIESPTAWTAAAGRGQRHVSEDEKSDHASLPFLAFLIEW
jgi:hypothetical protein